MMMTSCLVVAPINPMGMGTHGYFWARELVPLLTQAQMETFVLSNGDMTRRELEAADLNPLDSELKKAIGRPYPPQFLPDLSIGICAPFQFQDLPGKKRIGYIVFEGGLVPESDLKFLSALDAIAVPSNWGKEVLEKSFKHFTITFDKPIYVWPEGVDSEFFHPLDSAKVTGPLHDSSVDFTFSNIAKLEKRKGTFELISAFGNLVQKNPRSSLRLLAHWNNPWRETWMVEAEEALARAGFPKEKKQNIPGLPLVRFYHSTHPRSMVDVVTGALSSKDDIMTIYRASDAAVYPYAAEGWCLPLIESMACGIACIANPYSGPTEFLRKGEFIALENSHERPADDGRYFAGSQFGTWKEVDIAELAEKMNQMFKLSPQERNRMGKAASQYLKNEFSWARSAEKTFKDIRSYH